MMKHSYKKFVLGMLIGAFVGFALVLIIWQALSFDERRNESHVVNNESDKTLSVVQPSLDIDTWHSLLQTTEESLTLNDYVDLLEEKSVDELTRLVTETLELEQDIQIQLFQDLLITTLTHKSPQTTLDLIWKFPLSQHQRLVNLCVSTHSTIDLEQTIQLAQNLPNSYQKDALRTILATRPEFSQSDWEGLTEGTNVLKLVVRLLREAEVIAQLDQPSVAWDQLLQDDVENDEQQDLLVMTANARIEAEGFEVLNHFYESMYPNDRFLLESILSEILSDQPSIAFQTVKDMPYERRNFVLPILMEAWAIQYPKEAYFGLTEIADFQSRWGASRNILREWAKLDPLDVLNSLKEIGRSDRDSAVLAAFFELAKTNPDEIIERIEELKKVPGVSADDLEYRLVSSWSSVDPLNAINWVQEHTEIGSRLQSRMLARVLGDLILVDADKALEIAVNQPIGSYYVESGQIGNLIPYLVNEGNLAKAISLLGDLPDAAIYRGFSAVGRGLIEDNRWSDALELASRLESDQRESYLRSITSSATYGDVQSLIDQLKEMPDSEIRRLIVNELVQAQEYRGDVLTDQQLEDIRVLLPVKDQNIELNDS